MLPRALPAVLLTASVLAGQAPPAAQQARRVAELLLAERYEELHAAFSEELKARLSLETLRTQVGPSLKQLGKLEQVGEPVLRKSGELETALVPVKFQFLALNVVVTLDAQGRVRGLLLRPQETAVKWERPAYSRPDAFLEREVSVGQAPWTLPGTLTLPKGPGPWPAVALVHGSGPQDRDETVGNHKVFKDLAEGLASRGIAVLRYEKRTRQYAAQMAAQVDMTVRQETVEDALSAAALLRATPEIDPKRVFLLGHSLGGYLMPRMAREAPWLAGVVVMAGSTRPLAVLIVEQAEYLASLEPANQRLKQQAERLKQMAAEMQAIEEGRSQQRSVLGMPAAYLRDLKGYDPAAEMRKLEAPGLYLQGERDYQVRMADFARWKQALGGRRNAVFKSYPRLNHLFAPGEGRSTPAEYQQPGHVDQEVIEDIARWILARPAAGRGM